LLEKRLYLWSSEGSVYTEDQLKEFGIEVEKDKKVVIKTSINFGDALKITDINNNYSLEGNVRQAMSQLLFQQIINL